MLHPGTLELSPGSVSAGPKPTFTLRERLGLRAPAIKLRRVKRSKKLAAIQHGLAEAVGSQGDYDWAKQVEIERQVASAWLAHAEGRDDDALRLARAAADVDDATDKHPVTREQFFRRANNSASYCWSLNNRQRPCRNSRPRFAAHPNRFNGLYGAARAAGSHQIRRRLRLTMRS